MVICLWYWWRNKLFVVFSFILMSMFGLAKHLRSLHVHVRLNFLTSCVVKSPMYGIESQMVVESCMLWELTLVPRTLFWAFREKRWISELAIRLGKLFHDRIFLICLSLDFILFGEPIRCMRSTRAITHDIFLTSVVYVLVTMQLLGLTFILYVLKLSAGNG